ncbi:MAG: RecQ family ATP-dependent DNA helicase [Clostridiales bacterium]|nr:RecQ family ATP-dependent DNA helicase [Clostridiales bacterium]
MERSRITFIDAEVDFGSKKVRDIGAVKWDGQEFHSGSTRAFSDFLRGSACVCGHNIFKHDLKHLEKELAGCGVRHYIDTLYLSPLMFPKKPYHRLVKDDKLAASDLNNPLSDAKKARDLFCDEIAALERLPRQQQLIYSSLLGRHDEFKDFFRYAGCEKPTLGVAGLIREFFAGRICENAPIEKLVEKCPVELAYALSQITVINHDSATPPWVLKNYPRTETALHFLRGRSCRSCRYCRELLDEDRALMRFFHYKEFKEYEGAPLQKSAVAAAVGGKSVLAVFPTGGGKSITFQLPALMAGACEKGLTVVISPLQSLMKDQTDNLENQHNITEAVTINGSLDPLERAKAFDRVESGAASILYISPESLRSRSIESLLLKRNVVRFVVDEAHCFSSWGHDFRVDYLYIGDFIKNLQEKKARPQNIPVSCFTATAKQRVIADIRGYFKEKLSLELEVFRAGTARPNLSYHIFKEESSDGKYMKLRMLLEYSSCPSIVYVSRIRHAELLAAKLTEDGCPAKPYHGQMDKRLRVANQDEFMSGAVKTIVATTAFGMGVDKRDVGMVVHYDISDSLENYVQEAGRAGRDEKIKADCFVLFNDDDLNKHFNLLNQTRISRNEIQQVWMAVKELTKIRAAVSQSALEIARKSGWDDSVHDIETRIKTAVSALEQSGFVKRGQNMPRIFADSILVNNMEEARARIDRSARFDNASRQQAVRIIKSLISAKSKARGDEEEGEARVDYISDRLGIVKEDVIRVIGLLREERILADAKDLTCFIKKGEKTNRSKAILSMHMNIENFLFEYLDDSERTYSIKEMNEALHERFPGTSIKQLKTVLNYFAIKRMFKRMQGDDNNYVTLRPYFSLAEIRSKSGKRHRVAAFVIDYLYAKILGKQKQEEIAVNFSVLELKDEFDHNLLGEKARAEEIEDALYYLLKIDAIKIEGGFLVIYNAMRIERLKKDNKAQYSKAHYGQLEEYYKNRRQQIHIVGEYANRMLEDQRSGESFVDDYFSMDNDEFLNKHFKGRRGEINLNATLGKYKELFGELSAAQRGIVRDQDSSCIVVAAGPGSGKTKLLTHKLASIFMLEDVKHEQMLMLTFSRAAATEFKKRLMALIGNAANFIKISTFHSYCFDLLGRVGDLEKSDGIIEQTVEKIDAGEVDQARLTKTVLVIDEAQDMSRAEYSFIKTLMGKNEGMRVVAVGDDDQNIFEFRGSSSAYFESLLNEPGAKKYELTTNYRSNSNIVEFANQFVENMQHRMKAKPLEPKKKKAGSISVCKLASDNIAVPAVNALMEAKPAGTSCIVVRTNDEALSIVGLLLKNGIPAQKIQSNSSFNLCNLAELRDFMSHLGAGAGNYVATDEDWKKAKVSLSRKYEASADLPGVLKLVRDFEETNSKTKYNSDFVQFVRESKLEDFISAHAGTVLVSTIHQTKGREFDNVFLALSRFPRWDEARKRELFVAITRAKQNLHILCNGSYFDEIDVEKLMRTRDSRNYPLPSEISVELSHEDVFLSYFALRRKEVDSLMSGMELPVNDTGCSFGGKPVLKFSKKFLSRVEALKAKGYSPSKATVRHVLYWQGKGQMGEVKIFLPDIEFSK